MKKIIYPVLSILSVLIFCLSTVAFESDKKIESLTQAQLNEQSVLGINWVQQSAEYRALAYQAFNISKLAFDESVRKGVKNIAVVVDLDETVMDNTKYQASLIGTDNAFNSKTWNEWIKAEVTDAVPGAVEFVNYVNANGGKVFFISDRGKSSEKDGNNDLELATMQNLIKLGFNGVNEDTLLLKEEFSETVDGKLNTSKTLRRNAIEQGKIDSINYNIVLLVGDNLNDFDDRAGSTNKQRRDYVDSIKNTYGGIGNEITYVVLPNPMYGAWEGGMYNPKEFDKERWFEMTPSQINFQRKNLLIRWQK
jgi:5'-nucleotidase (lipoprotein e(P4) family)